MALTTYHEHREKPVGIATNAEKTRSRKEKAMSSVSPPAPYQLYVGVDIAAATATVSWLAPTQKPGRPITIEQTPEGFSSLHQRLVKTGAI